MSFGSAATVKEAWRRIIAGAVCKTLLVLAVALLNPFELLQWTELHSYTIWERLWAPGYGGEQQLGRNATSIIYVDEASQATPGMNWPMSMRQHEMMLEDVLARPAAAVFIDFFFDDAAPGGAAADTLIDTDRPFGAACESAADTTGETSPDRFRCYVRKVALFTKYDAWKARPQCQANALAKLACIHDAGGVPVIFADPTQSTGETRQPSTPAMTALGTVALTTPVDVSSQGYPLVSPEHARDRENRSFVLTPAAALYASYCLNRPEACSHSPSRASRQPFDQAEPSPPSWSGRFDAPVYVQWGVGRPDWFTDVLTRLDGGTLEQRCRPGSLSWLVVTSRLFEAATAGFHRADRKPDCPYSHSLSYAEFGGSGVTKEDLDHFVDGKLVVMGGRFRQSNDWAPSPVQGAVPGLGYHAMALANLIDKGASYAHEAPPVVPSIDLHWGKVLEIVLVFCIALTGRIGQVCKNQLKLEARHRGELLCPSQTHGMTPVAVTRWAEAAAVAVLVVLALIVARTLHWSELNWVGLLITAVPWVPEGVVTWLEKAAESSKNPLKALHLDKLLEFADVHGVTWSGVKLSNEDAEAFVPAHRLDVVQAAACVQATDVHVQVIATIGEFTTDLTR